MFAGIGGFRAGFERIGGFKAVGYCEIDKFAVKSYNAIFNTEGEYFHDDATKIITDELPDFDLLCAGFPCQSYSIAGQRKGFADDRGALFFEIVRLARAKRPKYLLLENVPHLLSHDKCKTFQVILSSLHELGYHVEWQVINSKDIGYPKPVPQSRRRVFAFCYLDGRCAGKVLPIIGENDAAIKQLIGGRQGYRVYDIDGVAPTMTSGAGGFAGKTGLYFIDLSNEPRVTDVARCIIRRYDKGVSNHKGESSGVLEVENSFRSIESMSTSETDSNSTMLSDKHPIPVLTPDRINKRQNGPRFREPNAPMFTLTGQDKHGILLNGRIRKLTPTECLRLQGFDEVQIDKILAIQSDSRVYMQAGNSVTVGVVAVLGARLRAMDEDLRSM